MHENNPALFHLYPLGEAAVVLEFGKTIHYSIHKNVRDFAACLKKRPFPGLIEYVPAFTTITIFYDPWVVSKQGLGDAYQQVVTTINRLTAEATQIEENISTIISIPVCYGGEFGPDLAAVARHSGLTSDQVIEIHSGVEYLIYMIGFAPGFPYLGGMDERIAVPRKASPSMLIPAGSVGIAGAQTGIYPIETPGGWQLIGRTPLILFDPLRQPPVILQAGDKVRFVPVSVEEYTSIKGAIL